LSLQTLSHLLKANIKKNTLESDGFLEICMADMIYALLRDHLIGLNEGRTTNLTQQAGQTEEVLLEEDKIEYCFEKSDISTSRTF